MSDNLIRLRWFGDDDDWVKKIMSFEVEGKRGRGRPWMMWSQVLESDMREYRLKKEEVEEAAVYSCWPTPA